jgi:hypothetical protein
LLKKIIMDSITGIDGETIDPARIFFCIITLEYAALAAFAVVNNPAHSFDLQSFAIGAGALLAGGGAGIALKADTEPKEKSIVP